MKVFHIHFAEKNEAVALSGFPDTIVYTDVEDLKISKDRVFIRRKIYSGHLDEEILVSGIKPCGNMSDTGWKSDVEALAFDKKTGVEVLTPDIKSAGVMSDAGIKSGGEALIHGIKTDKDIFCIIHMAAGCKTDSFEKYRLPGEESEGSRIIEERLLGIRNSAGKNVISSTLKNTIEDISHKKLVFVGGKGLKTKANFLKLLQLAETFGAGCGCSRAAALSGWADYNRVVGISGTSLNADLCITFGVSGAGPFLQGLRGVKKVIAVNTDPDAPVFTRADYGIKKDCTEIMQILSDIALQRVSE